MVFLFQVYGPDRKEVRSVLPWKKPKGEIFPDWQTSSILPPFSQADRNHLLLWKKKCNKWIESRWFSQLVKSYNACFFCIEYLILLKNWGGSVEFQPFCFSWWAHNFWFHNEYASILSSRFLYALIYIRFLCLRCYILVVQANFSLSLWAISNKASKNNSVMLWFATLRPFVTSVVFPYVFGIVTSFDWRAHDYFKIFNETIKVVPLHFHASEWLSSYIDSYKFVSTSLINHSENCLVGKLIMYLGRWFSW